MYGYRDQIGTNTKQEVLTLDHRLLTKVLFIYKLKLLKPYLQNSLLGFKKRGL